MNLRLFGRLDGHEDLATEKVRHEALGEEAGRMMDPCNEKRAAR